MKNKVNPVAHNELVALVSFMDTYERLAKQKADFVALPETDPAKDMLIEASCFVLEQVAYQLNERLEKCKEDQETHKKAEEAGLIISPNQSMGGGIMLPTRKN